MAAKLRRNVANRTPFQTISFAWIAPRGIHSTGEDSKKHIPRKYFTYVLRGIFLRRSQGLNISSGTLGDLHYVTPSNSPDQAMTRLLRAKTSKITQDFGLSYRKHSRL